MLKRFGGLLVNDSEVVKTLWGNAQIIAEAFWLYFLACLQIFSLTA
jgi:hypothetical protein